MRNATIIAKIAAAKAAAYHLPEDIESGTKEGRARAAAATYQIEELLNEIAELLEEHKWEKI